MHADFAYSTPMQIALVFVTYAKTFVSTYMIANIIMVTFNVPASRRQKMVFALITGSLLQNTFVYAVYLLGGRESFKDLVYNLVIHPSPIVAVIYYYTARAVFRLPPARSVKLMSYVYLFWIASTAIDRAVDALIFVQDIDHYNYLMDALLQILTLALFLGICHSVLHFLRTSHASLNFSENMFFNEKKELLVYFLKATFAYAVSVFLPFEIANQALAQTVVCLILLLFIAVNICLDVIRYDRRTIGNRDYHISALFKSIEELQGIKHDFNNVLHTYSGYIELKEYERMERYHQSLVLATSHAGSAMELAQRMEENPMLIALLIEMLGHAERMNVRLILQLKCAMDRLFIDDVDIARALTHLLRCAIATAADTEQRKVYATVESKAAGSRLIIITGSKGAADTHQETETTARAILGKHGNCTFQEKHTDCELSFYIELRQR